MGYDGLQNFSAVDRLLWAARINVDRVEFSFAGNGITLPLSQDADWVQVTTLLQCKECNASTVADERSTCLSCTDTCSLKLDLTPLLHTCMAAFWCPVQVTNINGVRQGRKRHGLCLAPGMFVWAMTEWVLTASERQISKGLQEDHVFLPSLA